ncbi:MAG: response regulator [Chloroflexi bacterium]|nr:response regulator [Chloroflexota bacterium]
MTKILIVDDDPNSQRVLSYTLRKNGYEVSIESNGKVGLAALLQTPFDLAILDIAMPVMDGLTLLRHIRSEESTRSIPVIILTASGDFQEQLTAEKDGANYFLLKPASSRTLLETVQHVLGSK